MGQGLEPQQPKSLELATTLDDISSKITEYLRFLGLPTESVILDPDQRRQAINNLPFVVNELNPDQRLNAMYFSKFVAACAMGLFDAALNYLWDETVNSLRQKVAHFDLNYFYDSVLTDSTQRAKFKDEADLRKLDDWVLIGGCRDTGIISDIGFKHLDYIRDMRNHASAAHPNQNEITGLQLVSWLQTCIKEVLAKEPSKPAFEVRRLLKSLREESLTSAELPHIASAVESLPEDLSRSLLRAIFGMYTDAKLGAGPRSNIRLIAPEVWRVCDNESRFETGLKQASLSANGEASRAKLAREFLQLVEGLSYLAPDTLSLEISRTLDVLSSAHYGMNNFHNESAPARLIQSLIPSSGEVPEGVVRKYIRVLTACAIGNGYGVSWAAEPAYQDLIERWQDKHAIFFVGLVMEPEIEYRLEITSCANRYQAIAKELQARVVRVPLKRALTFLTEFPSDQLANVREDSRFQELVRTLKIVR